MSFALSFLKIYFRLTDVRLSNLAVVASYILLSCYISSFFCSDSCLTCCIRFLFFSCLDLGGLKLTLIYKFIIAALTYLIK